MFPRVGECPEMILCVASTDSGPWAHSVVRLAVCSTPAQNGGTCPPSPNGSARFGGFTARRGPWNRRPSCPLRARSSSSGVWFISRRHSGRPPRMHGDCAPISSVPRPGWGGWDGEAHPYARRPSRRDRLAVAWMIWPLAIIATTETSWGHIPPDIRPFQGVARVRTASSLGGGCHDTSACGSRCSSHDGPRSRNSSGAIGGDPRAFVRLRASRAPGSRRTSRTS